MLPSKLDKRRTLTSATLQRTSQTSPLENVFGYRTRGSKGQFWTMLAPHGLTQQRPQMANWGEIDAAWTPYQTHLKQETREILVKPCPVLRSTVLSRPRHLLLLGGPREVVARLWTLLCLLKRKVYSRLTGEMWCNRFGCPISLSGRAVLLYAPCICTGWLIKAVVLMYSRLFRLSITLHFWQAPNFQWTLKELRFHIIKNLLSPYFI